MRPFDLRERVRLDNPFLTPAERTTIANADPGVGLQHRPATACRAPAAAAAWHQRAERSAQRRRHGSDYRRNLSLRHCAHAGSTSASATRSSSARPTASSAASAARSTTTGTTKSRPTTASSRKTRPPSASSTVSASCWRWMPGSIRPPARSSAARSSIRRPRPSRSGAQVGLAAIPRGNAGQRPARGRHRRLRALQSVRRAATTARRSTISAVQRSHRAPRFDQFVVNGLRRAATPASCSNCRAAPSASRSAPNIAGRRRYYDDRTIRSSTERAVTQTNNAVVIGRFDPDAFEVKEAFGEIQHPDPEGHAVLRTS